MRFEAHPVNTDDLIREYLAGRSIKEVADQFGVTEGLIRQRFRKAGIPIRDRRIILPIDEIVAFYESGTSENGIAKRFGVARNVIRLRLLEAGAAIRNQSEAERLKWGQMTPEERMRQVKEAHAATRGRPPRFDSLCKGAQTRQRKALPDSRHESELREMLADRGITTVPQEAVGPYNCDLGAFPVAVECWGGYHWTGGHFARTPKRTRYFLDRGWHVVIIDIDDRAHPLSPAAADYVVSLSQEARADPAMRRQYRVIWGTGELLVAGSEDDDEIAFVSAFTRGRDTLGCYTAVPR